MDPSPGRETTCQLRREAARTGQAQTVSHPPRVVLDSNVLLSALVFRSGVAAQLRHAWQTQRCTPLVSTATAQELIRVLACPKFGLSADDQQQLLADYLPWTRSVRLPQPPQPLPVACRDPFDVPFLQLALAGKARLLISGDRDLLALAG